MCNDGQGTAEQVILATGGYDHSIKLWQAHTGVCQRTVQHTDSKEPYRTGRKVNRSIFMWYNKSVYQQVNALDITPDKQLIAAAGYQHIRMYDLSSTNPSPVINYEGVSKNVTGVGFQEEGKWMYTGGEDCSARIWDLRSRNLQCQRIFQVSAPVNCVCLHPNQAELVVGDQSGVIHLWDLKTDHNEQLVMMLDRQFRLSRCPVKKNLKSSSTRNQVKVSDLSDLACQGRKRGARNLGGHRATRAKSLGSSSTIQGCRSTPENQVRRPCKDHLALMKLKTSVFSFFCQIPEAEASIQDIAIDPEGLHMAAVNNRGHCYIWSLTGGVGEEPTKLNPKQKIDAHMRYALKCKFSPDSNLLVTTSADMTVRIWKTSNFTLMRELKLEAQRWVWDAAFSADSTYILTASSDGVARLWNVETGTVEREYSGHQKAITSLAFRDELVKE
uniref:Target of rapamycin complex subunit lst8 n=1 Tax=Timema douglasi TaxID=61478 RepID=A0A7R8VDZ8_TIMDO|nr:unnamed protein product [Timema douglasi]